MGDFTGSGATAYPVYIRHQQSLGIQGHDQEKCVDGTSESRGASNPRSPGALAPLPAAMSARNGRQASCFSITLSSRSHSRLFFRPWH